jgi:hypothetical protein
MGFVLVGWVLFRAPSFSTAGSILGSLVGVAGFDGGIDKPERIAAAALASVLIPSAHEMKEAMVRPSRLFGIAAALLALACILEVGDGPPLNFIYFQF